MTDKNEKNYVVKHLEMVQAIVSRLAHNSFLLKGWSLTLLVATLIFVVRAEAPAWLILCLAVPILFFWGLDTYFLRQERLFRRIYNDVRTWEKTDFSMSVSKHMEKEKWFRVMFSCTLIPFYLMEILFIFTLFIVLFCQK